jgi:hypothetical protein
MILNDLCLYTLIGIIAVTLLTSLGAVASGKLSFSYVYLTPLSLVIFFAVGYMVSEDYSMMAAIFSAAIVGVYDAAIGWHLFTLFGANLLLSREELEEVSIKERIAGILFFAALFGGLGSAIGNV